MSEEQAHPKLLPEANSVRKFAGVGHIYLLGMAIVIGGLHVKWSNGLAGGFTNFAVAFATSTFGYLSLVLCTAELTSILPFGGGCYGFARVTMGNFMGCIIGYCDAFRCLTYVIYRLQIMGQMITFATGLSDRWEPLYWLLFFVPCIIADSFGSQKFWALTVLVSVVSIVVTLIYIFGASASADFDRYVPPSSQTLAPTFEQFVLAVRTSQRIYIGIATMPLCCDEAIEPRKSVPKAMVSVVLSMFALSASAMFVACAHFPGVHALALKNFPLIYGYSTIFNIPVGAEVLWSIPAVYASCFGFSYSYGRLMCAMSKSGLLPDIASWVRGERENPYAAMIGGNLLCFIVMLVVVLTKWDFDAIGGAGLLATMVANMAMFVSFIIFRLRFNNLQKLFVSPLGIPGAVVGLLIFTLPILHEVIYGASRIGALSIYFGFLFLTMLNYYRVRDKQRYSPEEQSVLLVLYVMKANRMRKTRKAVFSPKPVIAARKYRIREVEVHPETEMAVANTNTCTPSSEGIIDQSLRSKPRVTPVSITATLVLGDGSARDRHEEEKNEAMAGDETDGVESDGRVGSPPV